MTNFIWELYKISACKHLLSQPDRRFNYVVKVIIQPNVMTFPIICHREWCNSVKLRECMSDSLSLCMFCSAGAKRRATVPLFKAVCLSSSHHPPPLSCLSVYHPGPKVASLRSVLHVRIVTEEYHLKGRCAWGQHDGLDCKGGTIIYL